MPEMQDFVDSLCQCFGTNVPTSPDQYRRSGGNGSSKQQSVLNAGRQFASTSPSEANKSSSTRTGCSTILMIPERQFEALKLTSQRVSCFNDVSGDYVNGDSGNRPTQPTQHDALSTPSQSRKMQKKNSKTGRLSSSSSHNNNNLNNSNHGSSASHKRRRSISATSRVEDIFRSKTRTDSGFSARSSNGNLSASTGGAQANPFSRFLSNHPVIMNSLCFATPVKGESADDNNNPTSTGIPVDAQSVISQCDDDDEDDNTMTSTVFYETTKLAGLRQTSPPMPLFNHFAVDPERDDINKIVATHSHSSAKVIDMFHSFHKNCLKQQLEKEEEAKQLKFQSRSHQSNTPIALIELERHCTSADRSKQDILNSRKGHVFDGKLRANVDPAVDYDDVNPPPMMHCSSSGSKSSKSSAGCGSKTNGIPDELNW